MYVDKKNNLRFTVDDIFDDTEDLTENELWDYAEYLYDNDILPENIETFPKKIEKFIDGNTYKRKFITVILQEYFYKM